jgi:hypothetical protein
MSINVFYITLQIDYKQEGKIKSLVTSTIAQFYNLCFLSLTQLLRVWEFSPYSGSLHQNFIKFTAINSLQKIYICFGVISAGFG